MEQSTSKSTTDHDVIREWVERRGGIPATVEDTGNRGEDAGILRIMFPGHGSDENLSEIDWDQFFDKFDDADLAFVYQEKTQDGGTSRFCKLVSREQQE